MKHDEPYTLKDRRDDAAYVGELLGPWERIVDCRRLHATIVLNERLTKALETIADTDTTGIEPWAKAMAMYSVKIAKEALGK